MFGWQDVVGSHHMLASGAHVLSQVMMQHGRELPAAQQIQIVGIKVMRDKYFAGPLQGFKRIYDGDIAAADGINRDNIQIGF